MFGQLILGNICFGASGISVLAKIMRFIGVSFVEIARTFRSLVNIVNPIDP